MLGLMARLAVFVLTIYRLAHFLNIDDSSEYVKPVTPPRSTGPGKYSCVVEYHNRPYSLTWSGSSCQYPDLTTFPRDLDTYMLPQSEEMAEIWNTSALLDFGSHASVRSCCDEKQEVRPFPVLKLAHPAADSLALICDEIKILSDPAMRDLPTPVIDEQPIMENGVPVGFRMEMLFKLDMAALQTRATEVRQALQQLHDAGFSHADFSPSNVMEDWQGRITLTDLSHSGRIGEDVPLHIKSQGYPGDVYNADCDWKVFHRFFTPPLPI